MSFSNLVFFYRRRLRARRVQEFFALLGIAIGVALLFSVQVASTSLSASVEQLTKGLFGRAQWQLVARDPHGFNEHIVGSLRRDRDIIAAVPLIEAPANLVAEQDSASVTIVAAGRGLDRIGYGLSKGYEALTPGVRAAMLPDSVARAVSVHLGDDVAIQIKGTTRTVRVAATVDQDEVGDLSNSTVVLVPFAYGQELAGLEGRVSRVYVRARPGREAAVGALLRKIAGDRLDVRRVDADARIFEQAALPNDQSTGLFAAISAFVGFLFAFNALLLVAGQRRDLIAELRGLGFSRRATFRVLAFDALVLGLTASVLGLILGELLSRTVFPPSPGYLALAFPVGVGRVVPWPTVVLAVASGVLAALLAMLTPFASWLFPRSPAVRALLGRLPRSRWVFSVGVVCLGLASVVLFVAPGAAVVGMVALLASMLCCLPSLLSGVLAVGARLQHRVNSSVPMLAIGALRSNTSRSVAIAAIAAIALMGSISIEGSHRDLQRGLDEDVHQLSSGADLWVSAAGDSNALATTPFNPQAVGRISRLHGVASVQIQRGGFLDIGDRRVWVLAPPREATQPVPPSQILEGDVGRATRQLRGRGWAAVSQALADERHLRIGRAFTLDAPRPIRLKLAAIISNLGWTPGTVVVNAYDYEHGWSSNDASALRVDLADIAPAAGRRRVMEALGPRSGLVVETASEREHRQRRTARQGLARLTQIAVLVLGAAALAMAAAMGAMVWQRRQALAGVKLLGIRSGRIWKALLLESALLLGTGCTVGALYGLYGAQLLNRTLTTVTGFPVESSVAVPVALVSYGVLALVAFTIAAIASYFAAHVPTRTAFQD